MQVPNLQALGPIVEVQVTVGTAVEQALRAAGQLVPTPVKVLAQIDTGATGSVLQAGLPAQLNLNASWHHSREYPVVHEHAVSRIP